MNIDKDKITYPNNNKPLYQTNRLPHIGSVFMWSGSSLPNGAFFCDGTPKNKNTYPELFNVIGYRYGGSDPNFNLPNFTNKYLMGTDSLTNCTGSESGNWKIQNFKHGHIIPTSGDLIEKITDNNQTIETGNAGTHYTFGNTNMNLDIADNTTATKQSYRPTYVVCNYIIYYM